MAALVCPVASAISRTLLPSATPDRHVRLGRRQFQGRGHQGGIDARVAPRLDNQYQRGHVPRAVVRVREAHRLDVHHERRHHGRAAEHHRPADRDGARGRQRGAHQPVEPALVGRRAGAQPPVPVPHPIAAPQDGVGAVVARHDLPAPVPVEDDRAIFPGGARAVHITHKPIYRALGIENVKHRRGAKNTNTPVLMRRLLSLDYLIERPALGWLPTEDDKVQRFETLGIDRAMLPYRKYGTPRESADPVFCLETADRHRRAGGDVRVRRCRAVHR